MGTLVFQATLGGAINLIGPNTASTVNFTLPSADGSSGQALSTNGSGTLAFGTLAVGAGGTGLTSTPANGALDIGNGTGFTRTTLTAGSNITITNGAGSITIAASGGGASAATPTALGTVYGATSSGSVYTAAIGYQASNANTTGSGLVAIGYQAGYSNQSGNGNTAIGSGNAFTGAALYTNVSGGNNVAVGSGALTTSTGSNNTGVGYEALKLTNTGEFNVALGTQALRGNTSASNNVSVGYQAGYSTNTGANNAFLGYQAGYGTTSGYQCTALGANSLKANVTNLNCTAVGYEALTASTANSNTAIGQGAGSAITTGYNHTIIGRYTGNNDGLDIRTANNYIVLSDGDGKPRGIFDSSGNLMVGTTTLIDSGTSFKSSTSAAFYRTTSSTDFGLVSFWSDVGGTKTLRAYFQANGGLANYSANNVNLSDRREKINFSPATSYLDKICAIPVQTYNYIDQNLEEDDSLTLGVVAQDVQAIAPELVTESNWGTEQEPKMRLSIYQTDLQYALMKAIQELKAEFDAYKASHP